MGDDQKGFGIFQLSPPSQDMQYWNWKANVDRAKVMLDAMESEATTFWNNQVLQFDLWNFDFPGDQKDPPADEPEGDITFSFDPTGGQKTFRDAIWIKRFNGASGGHYIVWRNTGVDANDPFWHFGKTNNLGFNYVNRICSTTP